MMKKTLSKLIGKFFLLSIPLLFLMAFAWLFPMKYMEVEYTMWQEEKDFVSTPSGNGEPEVLILGDSRAKSSVIPALLGETGASPRIYNMAIGGATPIEMYYALTHYLSRHSAPETAFVIFAPYHFCEIDNWQQTLYYNYLPVRAVLETELAALRLKERGAVLYPGALPDLLSFRLRLPNKYLAAVYEAGFTGNEASNLEKYRSVRADCGYTEFGTEDGNSGLNYETHHEDFDLSPLNLFYYEKLLDLCENARIRVIVEQAPINEASAEAMHPAFMEGYEEFLTSLEEKKPGFTVVKEVPVYENRYFGDNNHMNRKGAEVYSAFLKEKYVLFQNSHLP